MNFSLDNVPVSPGTFQTQQLLTPPLPSSAPRIQQARPRLPLLLVQRLLGLVNHLHSSLHKMARDTSDQ
jgi:hypothetical protein